MTELIRTKRDGCWQVRSNSWGAFLQPVDDPLAEATLEKGALDRFELNNDIAPIPAELWSRWVQLCFHFCGKVRNDVEVSCRLLRHEDDKSQWRILIPQQDVDGASVRVQSFDEAIDITTGEVIASYPPPGWVPCGSSHSHNSMAMACFSGTDDRYELGDPGLHIVLSHIDTTKRTYQITASITANKRRFLVPFSKVLDATAQQGVSFHPDVLQLVQLHERAWQPLPAQAIPKWEGTSLRTHPNAGNGYRRDEELLLMDDPLWWDIQEQPRRPGRTPKRAMAGLVGDETFNHPICGQILEHIQAQLRRGQDEAVNDLLWELEDLTDCLRNDLLAIESDDPDTEHSTICAHPTAAGGLPPGEW